MRDDHRTFLVLAGAVTLLAFIADVLPALLLPPVFPTGDQGRRRLVAPPERRSEAVMASRGAKGHLDAAGALAAQERTEKPELGGSPWGGSEHAPATVKATQGGSDSRPVADAATSGNRRLDCMSTTAHRRHGARGAFAARSPVVARRPNTRPRPTRLTDSGNAARPAPRKGPRRTHESA